MNWQNTIPPIAACDQLSEDEISQFAKAWRNRELSSCDWTQLPDVDLANKWDWAVYRQQLRDLPQQDADPKNWVFPVRPA
jgi:hypothetical protein